MPSEGCRRVRPFLTLLSKGVRIFWTYFKSFSCAKALGHPWAHLFFYSEAFYRKTLLGFPSLLKNLGCPWAHSCPHWKAIFIKDHSSSRSTIQGELGLPWPRLVFFLSLSDLGFVCWPKHVWNLGSNVKSILEFYRLLPYVEHVTGIQNLYSKSNFNIN